MGEKLPTQLHGCGAHRCRVQKPVGQGTTAGCLASVLHARIDEYQRAWQQQRQRITELELTLQDAAGALHMVGWVDVETMYHHGGGYRCAVCLERPSDGHAATCRTKAALERAQKALEGGKL